MPKTKIWKCVKSCHAKPRIFRVVSLENESAPKSFESQTESEGKDRKNAPKRPRTMLSPSCLNIFHGGGVSGRAIANPCDSVLDAHGVGAASTPKGHLRNERVRRPRKNGTDAADLPKPIDLPPNIVLSTRTVAGFGARYVMKCCTCGSVGQVSNRTRFVGVHKQCSRKKVRIKLSEAERLHLHKQFQGPLSSWKRERAKRMLVSVT